MESAEIKRERARCIRECGGGFSDSVSRTLIDLADGLEIEADAIEKGSAADQIATNPLE